MLYISCWQTHFNLKLSNGTLLWKRSNTILPVTKIVEEFYWDCSHLDKKWFFVLFHASPVAVNFVNFWVFWRGEVNLTEFKNVKQVSKNTYSLFNFLNWPNCKLVRSLNKEWSLNHKTQLSPFWHSSLFAHAHVKMFYKPPKYLIHCFYFQTRQRYEL